MHVNACDWVMPLCRTSADERACPKKFRNSNGWVGLDKVQCQYHCFCWRCWSGFNSWMFLVHVDEKPHNSEHYLRTPHVKTGSSMAAMIKPKRWANKSEITSHHESSLAITSCRQPSLMEEVVIPMMKNPIMQIYHIDHYRYLHLGSLTENEPSQQGAPTAVTWSELA